MALYSYRSSSWCRPSPKWMIFLSQSKQVFYNYIVPLRPKLFSSLGQSLRDMSSDNGKWHGYGYVMEISWTDTFPLPIFLCFSFFLSLFLSRRASPSSFRSLPTILRHPLFLVPFFGSATITAESGTPHVLQLLGDLDDFVLILFFTIFFLEDDYKTSWAWAPLISVTARKYVGSGYQSVTLTTHTLCIEHSFFSLVKV